MIGSRSPSLAEKQLLGIPWRLALALQDDGWWLRSEIIWEKPNALPASVDDRPTCSHEHVFLLAKSASYFFDMNAVREPYVSSERAGRPHLWGFVPRPARPEEGRTRDRARRPRCRDRSRAAAFSAGTAIGDRVLDPFGGSGTVGFVAEQDGRHATLIDLDARACAEASGRCAQLGLLARAAE